MTKPLGISGRKCYGHLRWLLPMFYKPERSTEQSFSKQEGDRENQIKQMAI